MRQQVRFPGRAGNGSLQLIQFPQVDFEPGDQWALHATLDYVRRATRRIEPAADRMVATADNDFSGVRAAGRGSDFGETGTLMKHAGTLKEQAAVSAVGE